MTLKYEGANTSAGFDSWRTGRIRRLFAFLVSDSVFMQYRSAANALSDL